MVPASRASAPASARARRALAAKRALRSTSTLTVPATTMNTTRAITSSRRRTVNWRTGSAKNQLPRANPAAAAIRPGHTPPTTATITASAR